MPAVTPRSTRFSRATLAGLIGLCAIAACVAGGASWQRAVDGPVVADSSTAGTSLPTPFRLTASSDWHGIPTCKAVDTDGLPTLGVEQGMCYVTDSYGTVDVYAEAGDEMIDTHQTLAD